MEARRSPKPVDSALRQSQVSHVGTVASSVNEIRREADEAMMRLGGPVATAVHQTSARHARTFQKPGGLRVMQRANERQRRVAAAAAAVVAAGASNAANDFQASQNSLRDENRSVHFNSIPREYAITKPGLDPAHSRPSASPASLIRRMRAARLPTEQQAFEGFASPSSARSTRGGGGEDSNLSPGSIHNFIDDIQSRAARLEENARGASQVLVNRRSLMREPIEKMLGKERSSQRLRLMRTISWRSVVRIRESLYITWHRWKWISQSRGVATKYIILLSLRIERLRRLKRGFALWHSYWELLVRAEDHIRLVLRRFVHLIVTFAGRLCRGAIARWRAVVAMRLVQFAGARVNYQRSATLVIRFYRKIPRSMLRRAWSRWIDHDRRCLRLSLFQTRLRARLNRLARSVHICQCLHLRRAVFRWHREARGEVAAMKAQSAAQAHQATKDAHQATKDAAAEAAAEAARVSTENARVAADAAADAAAEASRVSADAATEAARVSAEAAQAAANASAVAARVAEGCGILRRFGQERFRFLKLAHPRFQKWRKAARVMKLAFAIANVRTALDHQNGPAEPPPPPLVLPTFTPNVPRRPATSALLAGAAMTAAEMGSAAATAPALAAAAAAAAAATSNATANAAAAAAAVYPAAASAAAAAQSERATTMAPPGSSLFGISGWRQERFEGVPPASLSAPAQPERSRSPLFAGPLALTPMSSLRGAGGGMGGGGGGGGGLL